MTRRVILFFITTASLLLANCQGNSLAKETIVSSTNTATLNNVTVTPSSEPTPTIISTITPIYSFVVNSQCPKLSDTFPKGTAKGVISYLARNQDLKILLNLETEQKTDFLPDEIVGMIIVSPDRNKIAYAKTDPKTFETILKVRILDEQNKIEMPWPFEYSLFMPRWQDNEHILFTLRAEDKNDTFDPHPYRNALVNPFTKEITILRPDFPAISTNSINWDSSGSVAYDQSLDYVIYAAWDEANHEHKYVLWHIPSQTKLAEFPGNSYGGRAIENAALIPVDGVTYNPPTWSPDNTRVAIIGLSPDKPKVDEIFAMAKDGTIRQLTKFSSQYKEVNIRTLSWSPYGKQIAFFINTEPNADQITLNEQLAILDTRTGTVTLYCINGDTIGTGTRSSMFLGDEQEVPAPLWFSDATQLIIENRYKSDASRLILVDIPSNTAYEIGQNMQPLGWMLSEP
jgi:hypothetical protein